MGNKENLTLDPENRLPIARYQFINVRFETAGEDVVIKHRLAPVNAEQVMYQVVRLTSAAVIYQDQTPTRKPWQRSHIYLRSDIPTAATLMLFLPSQEEDLIREAPAAVPEVEEEVTTSEKERSFGITIDNGSATIGTGIKGFVRVPVAGYITRYTLLSTDASVTSGSIVIDIWRDAYPNYAPTVADSIIGGATPTPPTLSSATAATDSALAGWVRYFPAGSVFGFKVDSASSVKRVTLTVDYVPM